MLPSDEGGERRWTRLLLPEVHILSTQRILQPAVVRVIRWRKCHDIAAARREETPEERLGPIVVMVRRAEVSIVARKLYDVVNDSSIHRVTFRMSGAARRSLRPDPSTAASGSRDRCSHRHSSPRLNPPPSYSRNIRAANPERQHPRFVR